MNKTMMNELNCLLNDYEGSKDFVENGVENTINEVREWCREEIVIINDMRETMNEFVNKNINLFTNRKYFHLNEYVDKKQWYGYKLIVLFIEGTNNYTISIDSNYEKTLKVGVNNSRLPHPINDIYGKICWENKDPSYWVDVKRAVAIWREENDMLFGLIKNYLATLDLHQKTRFRNLQEVSADLTHKQAFSVSI